MAAHEVRPASRSPPPTDGDADEWVALDPLGDTGAVAARSAPSTVVRATGFHEFIAELLGKVAWVLVWPLPTRFDIQPIAASEAAAAFVEHPTTEAAGRVTDVGGPEVHTVGDCARAYREARGRAGRSSDCRSPTRSPPASARGRRPVRIAVSGRSPGRSGWAGKFD